MKSKKHVIIITSLLFWGMLFHIQSVNSAEKRKTIKRDKEGITVYEIYISKGGNTPLNNKEIVANEERFVFPKNAWGNFAKESQSYKDMLSMDYRVKLNSKTSNKILKQTNEEANITKTLWSLDDEMYLYQWHQNTVNSIHYEYYIGYNDTTIVHQKFFSFDTFKDKVPPPKPDELWWSCYPYDLSADKRYVIFSGYENKQWDLWLFCLSPIEDDPYGPNNYLLKLTNDPEMEFDPKFNPTADHVLFTIYDETGYRLWELSLLDFTCRRVSYENKDSFMGRYAPFVESDFDKFCYVLRDRGQCRLLMKEMDVDNPRELAKEISDSKVFPTWAPNKKGAMIAYFNADSMLIYDIEKERSFTAADSIYKPEFNEKNLPAFYGPVWICDGNNILYLKQDGEEGEISLMLVEIAADFSKVVSRRTFVDRSTGGKYMCEAVIGKNNGSYTIIDKSIWEAKKFEIDLEKYEPPDTIRTYYTYTLELARDSLKFYTPEELDSMGTQKNFKNILGKLSRLDEYYGYEEVPAGIKYTVKMTDIEPKNGIHTLELFGEQQDLLPKDLDKLKNRTKYEITVISDDELIKKDFFALYYYLIPYSEEVPLPQMEKH